MKKKSPIKTIADLCMAINTVEGTDVAPEYQEQNDRICKTLYDLMIEEATKAFFYDRVSIKKLDSALKKAGWDDQTFVSDGPTLSVKNIACLSNHK